MARVIDKPLLVSGDAMEERNASLAGYSASTICRRRDPQHEQHEELLDWLGDGFDPEAFSADEVNRRLAPLQRRRNKAAALLNAVALNVQDSWCGVAGDSTTQNRRPFRGDLQVAACRTSQGRTVSISRAKPSQEQL